MHDRALLVKHLGRCDYLTVWQAMREFTDRRQADTPDELWLLEHHPVYTQGLAGEEKHLLNPGLIPIIHTDRGGQVTYHGPGQLVCYLLFDITRMEMGTRTFVRKIEDAVIRLLNHHYDIPAQQRCDAPGVYVEESKICSLGLRVRKGKSYHGLALNVDMDLEPFTRINPCGFNQLQMTQIANFKYVQMENVIRQLTDAIIHVFNYEIKVMIHRPEITRLPNVELAYA